MQEIIDFVVNHLDIVLGVFSICFSLLSCLIYIIFQLVILVKTSKDPAVGSFILEQLPSLILKAEALFKDGIEKKKWVFNEMTVLISKKFPKLRASIFYRLISKSIESILSCPQKKEEIIL